MVSDDPTREVPNPTWAAVDAEFRQAQAHLDRLQAVQSALASAADIEVTNRELRITVAPMSSAHRTRAIAALCEELNRTETIFPGSRLRLNYAIRES